MRPLRIPLFSWTGRDIPTESFRVFDTVFIPESVLREIKLPPAVDWVAESLASDKMALFTETSELEAEARRLMAMSRERPLKRIDFPEAVCLAAGLRYGYVVLTENGGAYFAPKILGLNVVVWRAFEVIVEAWRRGYINNVVEELRKYERETLHLFRKKTGSIYVNRRDVRVGRRG
ncbi:DNA-binding protein [Pyrobaculum aerophilum]|uniref:DNA-binding protein n=1 Tax=Pyrobaculum aerophilum TaxID=13773 RepID=UPI0021626A54|nr:DNA-binding protein [Pyrobaculum aerophilum]